MPPLPHGSSTTACVDRRTLHGELAMPIDGTETLMLATPALFANTVAWNRMLQPGTGRKSTDWFVVAHGGSGPRGIAGKQAFGGHGIEQPRHGQSVHTMTTTEPTDACTVIVRVSGEAKHNDVQDVEPGTSPLSV